MTIILPKVAWQLTAIAVLLLQLLTSAGLPPTQPTKLSPDQLVRRVIDDELSAETQDHSYWMFRLQNENKNGQKEVDEIVETRSGNLVRPILRNGRELTAKQRQESDRQLGRNPAALRKSLKEKREDTTEDTTRSHEALKALPDAFTFSPGEEKDNLEQFHFKPNPKFHPKSHETEVFHAMEGNLWLDVKQSRLAEISGHLSAQVKFGGGVLGHLDKGGTRLMPSGRKSRPDIGG